MAESVSRRLQESKEYGRTIEISIRNNQLKWSAVQMTVDCPVCTTSELAHIAMYLFQNKYRFVSPVRALGIRVCNLVNRKEDSQISFNRNVIKQARQEAIDGCVGYLKKRFGKNIIKPASILNTGVPKNTDI
ncbi:MAG TPA: hypothetical protein DEP42_05290 [Ruminococcaceae bacterium]|nr:hypothetical protein [Oscillospiraceae bacterium]